MPSMLDDMLPNERKTLLSWYKYAQAWGYWHTKTGKPSGSHSEFEVATHELSEHYHTITACSDNVFRNIVKAKLDDCVLKYDVIGKAKQCENHKEELIEMCNDDDNTGRKLLTEFFDENSDGKKFADELEHYKFAKEISIPFEIILTSAMILFDVVFSDDPKDVEKAVNRIIKLRKKYEKEEEQKAEAESRERKAAKAKRKKQKKTGNTSDDSDNSDSDYY